MATTRKKSSTATKQKKDLFGDKPSGAKATGRSKAMNTATAKKKAAAKKKRAQQAGL